jgi:hypothetical protein
MLIIQVFSKDSGPSEQISAKLTAPTSNAGRYLKAVIAVI